MARAGIYKSEVMRARDNLLAMGRYPSIDAIRHELGDTGSKGTVSSERDTQHQRIAQSLFALGLAYCY